MDDLLRTLVSGVLAALLIALVGAFGARTRRRGVARAEAAAPTPVEEPSRALLRRAEEADRAREAAHAQGRADEALAAARVAVDRWTELGRLRADRFAAERQAAVDRLAELGAAAGSA
ncbi:hypothetical protein ACGFX4_06095 [Kitasatospora sp. NPDC048365]|uniref:hypothetical protein n=1 Tax=Kitasatospora sp. NPDC048365 TaxID=3364050 RepID=UPI003724A475